MFREQEILEPHMAIKHVLRPKHDVVVFAAFQPLVQPVMEEWYLLVLKIIRKVFFRFLKNKNEFSYNGQEDLMDKHSINPFWYFSHFFKTLFLLFKSFLTFKKKTFRWNIFLNLSSAKEIKHLRFFCCEPFNTKRKNTYKHFAYK